MRVFESLTDIKATVITEGFMSEMINIFGRKFGRTTQAIRTPLSFWEQAPPPFSYISWILDGIKTYTDNNSLTEASFDEDSKENILS